MTSQYIKLPVSGGSGPSAGVDSFNGRTGVVVSQVGDYSAGIVANTPAGNISATTVQAAINELDTEKQATITGAATTITSANLTANRAVVSDGGGKVAVSTVTSAELANLSGVTSAIQTQLDGKQPIDSDLSAIAALSSTGLIARTGAGTASTRALQGTANQITVTNGDGVAGNPVISLSNTGAISGSYTNPNITVDSTGRILAIASGSAASQSPDTSRVIVDDFIANTVTTGAYAWAVSNTGTGSNATIGVVGSDITENALGVMNQTTGSTTTGRTTVTTGLTTLCGQIANMSMIGRISLASYGTVPDQYEFTFGGIDNTASTTFHNDGIYFRFNGDGVNTTWDCVTSAGGINTITNTAVVVTLDQYQIFQIIMNSSSTQVQFFINGVLVATHTTNIPQVANRFGFGTKIMKISGTTAMTCNVDYLYLELTWPGPR